MGRAARGSKRGWLGAYALALLWGLTACGAKTGLYADDAARDAPTDAGVDAPDARDSGPPVRCVPVPRGEPVRVALSIPAALAVVDVFFLLGATASMLDEIETIRRRLRSEVVPGVRDSIPDPAFGVALVGEFPRDPHGPDDVRPFELRQPITTDVLQVEGALERLPTWGNFDEPEAQVEGLYQVATGDGLMPWIPRSLGCPGGGIGGACFRREALPVILLITDAPMNNGPPGVAPVSRYRFEGPHSYGEAVVALGRIGAFVIGLGARDQFAQSPMSHLRQLAIDTRTTADGAPLAFDIGRDGSGVGRGIVDSVARLAEGTPLDVDALVEDIPGDSIDARDLVQSIRPLDAQPADGTQEITEDAFLGVRPGTVLRFELTLAHDLPMMSESIRVPARVLFRAFGRSRLAREEIEILIPGTDGEGCESL